jgi:hypothetical protein
MENTKDYRAELYVSGMNSDSVFKLDVNFIEEEDGSGTIQIEWDETDADLQWWTNLEEEKQKQFLMDALTAAIEQNLPEETIDNEP